VSNVELVSTLQVVFRSAVKKSAPAQTRDDYDEPKPGGGRRLLVSGLAFVSFLAILAATVLKLT
jgi:hypothetical protein